MEVMVEVDTLLEKMVLILLHGLMYIMMVMDTLEDGVELDI